jgi:tRNA intron endonuclease, catalytic C-terminal domain
VSTDPYSVTCSDSAVVCKWGIEWFLGMGSTWYVICSISVLLSHSLTLLNSLTLSLSLSLLILSHSHSLSLELSLSLLNSLSLELSLSVSLSVSLSLELSHSLPLFPTEIWLLSQYRIVGLSQVAEGDKAANVQEKKQGNWWIQKQHRKKKLRSKQESFATLQTGVVFSSDDEDGGWCRNTARNGGGGGDGDGDGDGDDTYHDSDGDDSDSDLTRNSGQVTPRRPGVPIVDKPTTLRGKQAILMQLELAHLKEHPSVADLRSVGAFCDPDCVSGKSPLSLCLEEVFSLYMEDRVKFIENSKPVLTRASEEARVHRASLHMGIPVSEPVLHASTGVSEDNKITPPPADRSRKRKAVADADATQDQADNHPEEQKQQSDSDMRSLLSRAWKRIKLVFSSTPIDNHAPIDEYARQRMASVGIDTSSSDTLPRKPRLLAGIATPALSCVSEDDSDHSDAGLDDVMHDSKADAKSLPFQVGPHGSVTELAGRHAPDETRYRTMRLPLYVMPPYVKQDVVGRITSWPRTLSDALVQRKIAHLVFADPGTLCRILVSYDLWKRGYWTTRGMQFAGDFLVYAGSPDSYHADFILNVQCPNTVMRAIDAVAISRLGTNTKKTVLHAKVEFLDQRLFKAAQGSHSKMHALSLLKQGGSRVPSSRFGPSRNAFVDDDIDLQNEQSADGVMYRIHYSTYSWNAAASNPPMVNKRTNTGTSGTAYHNSRHRGWYRELDLERMRKQLAITKQHAKEKAARRKAKHDANLRATLARKADIRAAKKKGKNKSNSKKQQKQQKQQKPQQQQQQQQQQQSDNAVADAVAGVVDVVETVEDIVDGVEAAANKE